jgi:hypothetical protein
VVTRGWTGLRHGCPTQALVAAFGGDERPVAAWLSRAGQHCQRGPQPLVPQGRGDLPHVQAAALWVKLGGRRGWLAMALAVPSRRGLGGVMSGHRDLGWITPLVQLIRAGGRSLARLVGVDGVASSVTAIPRVCRPPVRTGHRGRPRLVAAPGWLRGQGVTRSVPRRVVSVERRVVRGTAAASAAGLAATGSGTAINTAAIARLNATVRAALAPVGRRGRALAPTEMRLTVAMRLVGGADNVCGRHDRRRLRAPAGACWKWQARTPAMAAGLRAQRWTMRALFHDPVPLPPWVAPTRRGRLPKPGQHPVMALAA